MLWPKSLFKWKWKKLQVAQLCLTLCDPHGLYSPWNSLGQNTGVGSLSLTQGSNPGLPHCRWILYQLGYQGKPKNTGVGSLSLLMQIFLSQESNRDLLHCRWILYQLSYQGSRIAYLTISFLCLKFSNTQNINSTNGQKTPAKWVSQ